MGGSRRTRLVALAGMLVAAVLAGGVFTAVAVERRSAPANDQSAQATGGLVSELAEAAEMTTSTWPFVPTPPTTAPPTTKAAVPTSRRPTTTSRPPVPGATTTTTAPLIRRNSRADYGATYPPRGAVEVPYTPGQTSWTGVSNGVTFELRIDKPARAGEPLEFDVQLSSTTRPCCAMHLLFGDGYYGGPGSFNCSNAPTSPGTGNFHASHVYNLDGLWLFSLSDFVGTCQTPAVDSILMGTIEVHPGSSTAQGPSLPQVDIERTASPAGHEGDFSWASVAGSVREADGWIRSVTIDWGDGSAPTSLAAGSPACRPSLANWPGPDMMWIGGGQAVHHYVRPGSYTVVATAVSTGCDGSSTRQTGSDQLVWTVPTSG